MVLKMIRVTRYTTGLLSEGIIIMPHQMLHFNRYSWRQSDDHLVILQDMRYALTVADAGDVV